MQKLSILLFGWIYDRRLTFLKLCLWGFIIYCLMKQHVYTAFILMFLISIKGIIPIRERLIKIIKSAFLIKFYNVFVWFLSYIISLKLLSYTTGIGEDKLKFSPVIMAIPVSVILIYFFVLIFSFLMIFVLQILTPFSVFMTTRFKNRIIESKTYAFASRFNYLIILLAPFLLVAIYISPPFMRLALLADSSFISDCGVKEKSKTYIRINQKSCLRFDLNIFTLANDPVVIASEVRKPG